MYRLRSPPALTLPQIHVVHFDGAGKIQQIRLNWDQGALLKQIDVIGARSRNWPIRDSKEQSRLIASSSNAVAAPESAQSSRPSTASRGADEVSVTSRSRGSTNNAMNDPHASLSLFQPRSVEEEDSQPSRPITARVQSAKPPPREYSELFVGENSGSPSPSPQKIPTKAGGGKNYKASRLFDETEEDSMSPVKGGGVKTNPKKYEHFTFGDNGEDAPKVRSTARNTQAKGEANWDFESFATPAKTKQKTLPNNVRHFGWSDDEVGPYYQPEMQEVAPVSLSPLELHNADMNLQEEVSPVRRPIVHKARPDADPHFEFVDDGTPDGQRKQASTKGQGSNKGQGLYQDHVTGTTAGDAGDAPYDDDKKVLSDVTQNKISNENRQKDFGAQWEINDNSPANSKHAAPKKDTHKATKTNWGLYQDSPDARGGINIAGNGMGGRKGTEFSLYDDDSPAPAGNESKRYQQQSTTRTEGTDTGSKKGGINIAGNGMGGKKGTEFSLFDDSPSKNENERVNQQQSTARGKMAVGDGMGGKKGTESFWDF